MNNSATLAMFDPELLSLLEAVRQAGHVLLSMWPKDAEARSALDPSQKRDGTFVTQADLASNQILMKALKLIYPNDLIYSEEGECDVERIRAATRAWIVDPLDGTTSFMEGRDDFSILVGLAIEHCAYAGIQFFPARDRILIARSGLGAYMNGKRLAVSSFTRARAGCVYMRNFTSLATGLASPAMDSGLALAQVACGDLDGAIIKMVTHREWDIAAPMAILHEAGATVTDETGAPIRLGRGSIEFDYFIASNGAVHAELLATIPKS